MDFDTLSPAALYFESDNFVLQPETPTAEEITLWMSFTGPAVSPLSLTGAPGTTQEVHIPLEASTVDVALAELEARYNVLIPASFREKPRRYLDLAPHSFSLLATLEPSRGYFCETCGTSSGTTLEAFYFPPLAPGEPASLGVHHAYGCFGGEAIYGALPEVRTAVLRLLQEVEETPFTLPSGVAAVAAFREQLEAVS